MLALGMAGEFRHVGPRLQRPLAQDRHRHGGGHERAPGGEDTVRKGRTVEIMADAAHAIPHPAQPRGHRQLFSSTREVLRAEGVTDFEPYRHHPRRRAHAGFLPVA